jgi:hypothetical protein
MEIRVSRKNRVLVDMFVKDVSGIDSINIKVSEAKSTPQPYNDDSDDEVDFDMFADHRADEPEEFVSVYKPRPCDDVPHTVDDIIKAKKARKSKDQVLSEEALLSADAALIRDLKIKKG